MSTPRAGTPRKRLSRGGRVVSSGEDDIVLTPRLAVVDKLVLEDLMQQLPTGCAYSTSSGLATVPVTVAGFTGASLGCSGTGRSSGGGAGDTCISGSAGAYCTGVSTGCCLRRSAGGAAAGRGCVSGGSGVSSLTTAAYGASSALPPLGASLLTGSFLTGSYPNAVNTLHTSAAPLSSHYSLQQHVRLEEEPQHQQQFTGLQQKLQTQAVQTRQLETQTQAQLQTQVGQVQQLEMQAHPEDQAQQPEQPTRTIYDAWTERKRYMLLALMSFATFLVPFSDTVYLPALSVIQHDLGTTPTLMAATIAVYMFVVGVTALIWGPCCDRWGRRNTLLVSCSTFTGFCLGCVFAPSIYMLLAFRALQGAAVSALMVAANAVLADSWEPSQRGKAMGVFAIPTLVGPIVGPLLGGGLSQMLGWRSTFASMAVCGVIICFALLFFMEETHHHHVLKRIRVTQGTQAVLAIKELSEIQKPRFRAPWRPLKYVVERELAVHVLVTVMLYSTMLGALTILPGMLARPPYSMSETLIGVSNLPIGLGCLIVGPISGSWADAAARRWPSSPASRLIPGLIAGLLVFPVSTVAYAWTFQMRVHVAYPLMASFFFGAAICAFFPGLMSYVSILKQQTAAAAGAGVQALLFIAGGMFIQLTPIAMSAIGLGWWVTILAGATLVTTALSMYAAVSAIRAGAGEALPVVVEVRATVIVAGGGSASEKSGKAGSAAAAAGVVGAQ